MHNEMQMRSVSGESYPVDDEFINHEYIQLVSLLHPDFSTLNPTITAQVTTLTPPPLSGASARKR